MFDLRRASRSTWAARLSFGALLLVFSELVIWQTPTRFDALEWAGLAVLYVALAAIGLDLVARFHVSDVFSLLLLAGMFGLVDATLVSHVTTRDLPLSLLVRPLGALPLAFMGALFAFRLLLSGRASGPLHLLAALFAGLLWGIWVRWLPVVSDDPIPAVGAGTALAATGTGLLVGGLLPLLLRPTAPTVRAGWRLNPFEWAGAGGVLIAAFALGVTDGEIERTGVGLVVVLLAFMVVVLQVTHPMRPRDSLLDVATPPGRPNLPGWLLLVVPFLLAGWGGYSLPGGDDRAVQSDILFGMITGFGVMWLPAVSVAIGMRAFMQIAREEG